MQVSSNNRQRILALGILFIAVLLFILLFVQPYLGLLNKSAEYLDSMHFQSSNHARLLRKKDFYLDEIDRLEFTSQADDVYLQSTKKSLASAEIQQIFKRLAENSQAELISSQSIGEDVDGDNSVGLRVRLKADIFSLQKLIYQLETASPSLVIKEITINRGSRAIFKFSKANSKSQTLDVRMQVFGYLNSNK